ncbi:MAG TPA: Ig-like domain-containing protein, partial [Vicinamibacterales bacterium]|nr:Ig-like domain-containing protein [Vicinamibacterales bacterium]
MDAGTLVLTGSADASGKFSFTYPFNGQSGYQVARVRVVGSDGSLSPADEVSFRYDCSAPQVVGASYDRTVNTLTISFSKPVDPATLVVSAGGTIVLTTNLGNTSSGTFSASGSNVTVTPADDLRTATFTLTVTDGVKDAGGNKLVAPFSQTFSLTGDDLPPAPGDGSGFISGEVYDASTGRPLAAANVTIIVPTTAFAKAPSTDSRYTVIGTPTNVGQALSLSSPASKGRVSSNSLSVAVNSATESRGRYTLPLPEGAHTIQATAEGYTTVWRQIIVPAGAGVVPIDIRLAKRGDVKTSDGATGITLSHGGDSVITRHVDATLPAGAVASGSKASLTAVGAQSLAGLLPLGWSPLASAELAVLDSAGALVSHAPLGSNASITFTLPSSEVAAANQVLSLVQYDEDRDEWRVLVPVMTAGANDKWTATITNSGAWAVVYHDKASAGLAEPPAAVGGATLQAASGTCAPCELVKKSFDAEPKTILPNGRTVATLQIVSGSTTKFPSGTAVQAYVNEELHLPGGTTLVDPPFATDVLLYRNLAGDTGFGQFYLAPSQQATKYVLSDGVDHIQILQYPGRLDRGTLIGTEGGRVPGDEAVSVEIPSSATTEQLHASVSSLAQADLASYGTIAGFRIVGGFSLTMSRSTTPAPQDLDGDGEVDPIPPVTLSRPARATVAIDTNQLPAPGSLVLVAEVVEHPTWGRIIRLADPMTAIDTPQNGVTTVRYTTRSIDPAELPVDGVIREGHYLILAAEAPVAWATGAVRGGGAGGAFLADARLTSFSQPSSAQLGVADSTRNTGVFAIPVAAVPASGFALLPKHAGTGEGTLINSTSAPAPDTVVKLGNVILTPQSPQLVDTIPANGALLDVSTPLVVTMHFNSAIDPASAADAISAINSSDNTALTGAVSVASSTVTLTPSRPLVAGAQYVVTIHATLRGVNGASFGHDYSFSFSTKTIATNQGIDPLKVHITIPENGVSRISGEAGAIPAGWHLVPVRQGVDFITRYQTAAANDGSFSLLAGSGIDASDRITVDDVIDLDVINPAGNIAAVIRLTPFITADGKGFIAPFGVTTTFRSAEGIVVTVPAGAFDEPRLVNVAFSANNDVFNDVPNIANEIHINRTVNITFEGIAKQRIDLSIPLNGLPADRDYFLGYLGQSVWGPRVAMIDTLRVDGDTLTTSYPPEAQVRKTIAAANSSGLKATPNAGLTDMQAKGCLAGVVRQGSYATMDWSMPTGFVLGYAIISGIADQVEVFNSLFHAIYLPDFAFNSRDHCAVMPIAKEKPFTLTGVDPATGMVQFKTAYDPIALTDPGVVNIPSPAPDKKGPYPVFGSPFRIETIDFTGTKFYGRGYELELVVNPPSNQIQLKYPQPAQQDEPPAPPLVPLGKKVTLRVYNITKGTFSASTTTDDTGHFPPVSFDGDRGDQLVVYLGSNDISSAAKMNVVFSEPVEIGNILPSDSDDQKKKKVDDHLHTALRLERILDNTPTDITKSATFSVDSQNRRVWVTLPAPMMPGYTYKLTMLKDTFKDPAGNRIGEMHDGTPQNTLIGNGPQDLALEFKVRENETAALTNFDLRATPVFPGGSLRDITRSGNLAFVSATEAGILVYDLSDTDALKNANNQAPAPYSQVPALWRDEDGKLLPGANGFEQHWAVTADQHNRVYGAGFTYSFGAVRVYKVEDFVKAHNDNDGSLCSQYFASAPPDYLKKANCAFHGAAIVGWRPGYAANMPLSTNLAMTDYPDAYPRKMQIATQDDTKNYDGIYNSPGTTTAAGMNPPLEADNSIQVTKTEIGITQAQPHPDNYRLQIKVIGTPLIQLSPEQLAGYLVERITVVNKDLDLRWSADRYLGEDVVIKDIIGRKKDRFAIIRNTITYNVITMLGYGISIYDMRAVETNDALLKCGNTAFAQDHAPFCSLGATRIRKIPEKILNTRGDGQCNEEKQGGATPMTIPEDGIQNVQFSAESIGYLPGALDTSTNPPKTVYTTLQMYGLDPRRGVLDMSFKLATDADLIVNKCPTRALKGLTFRDPAKPDDPPPNPRLVDVKAAAKAQSGTLTPRFNGQALFHWEVTAAQNAAGLRGSKPGDPASRDYLLIAGGSYGLLVVEIGGTRPPNGPMTYSPLENGHLTDVIWFASGCYALRVIP